MATESNQYEILSTARFYLELHLKGSDERIDGYFMECQGFKRSQDVIEHCEVTPGKWGKDGNSHGAVVRTKLPGNPKSDNITLKNGLTISTTFWDWLAAVEKGEWSKQRRDGDLTVYDQAAEEQARFRFEGAWPVSYKLSDFSGGGSDLAIVDIELAVDQFYRVT